MSNVVVDRDTGEILTEINEGDKILRKESSDYLNKTVEWGKDWQFVKTFTNEFHKVSLELTGGAVAVMHTLSTYISYGSNLVCNRSTNYPLNNEDIMSITKLTNKTLEKIMDELISHKVLARVKVGKSYQYYANPYIYCKGNRINKTLVAMFKSYKYKPKQITVGKIPSETP